jgi:hypothetical protein
MANTALLSEYHAAREAYDDEAERVTIGYATETAEYKAEHAAPTLKAFLVGLKAPERATFLDPRNYRGRELSELDYIGCADGWHEWSATMFVRGRRARYRAVVRCYPDDTWAVTVWHALAGRDQLLSDREWDAVLHSWSDDCLREAKYGN